MRLQKAAIDRHTDRLTDRHTNVQTGLIPGVSIFSNELTYNEKYHFKSLYLFNANDFKLELKNVFTLCFIWGK